MSNTKRDMDRIQKYFRGKLKSQERYEIEREALDDPFLHDALEGYENSPREYLEDIEPLKKKVNKRSKKTLSHWHYYTSAAAVLVAVFFLFLLINDSSSPQTESQETVEMPTDPPELIADNLGIAGSASKERRTLTEESQIERTPSKSTEIIEEENVIVVEPTSDAKIVDQNKEIPKANDVFVDPSDDRQSDQSEVQNDVDIKLLDEIPQIAQARNGAESPTPIMSGVENEITEVRVPRSRSLKNSTSVTKKQQRSFTIVAEPALLDSSVNDEDQKLDSKASPNIGYPAYSRYLIENLMYPESALKDSIQGVVGLVLTIAKEGSIREVSIVKSLSKDCDLEAVRLVKEGPVWLPASSGGLRVEDKIEIQVLFQL
ncbi:MAG: TonB family protein [Bacteroidota bacterium]